MLTIHIQPVGALRRTRRDAIYEPVNGLGRSLHPSYGACRYYHYYRKRHQGWWSFMA